jgi:hypothetical protein
VQGLEKLLVQNLTWAGRLSLNLEHCPPPSSC